MVDINSEIQKQDDRLEYYDKFPAIIKKQLVEGVFCFPKGTQFEYSPFIAYRSIEREDNDDSPTNREDMRTHPELGRKKPRNVPEWNWYSTSLFTDVEELKQKMKFPRPNSKIVFGEVRAEGGPHYISAETSHVSWWLFEDADVSHFEYL